VLTYAIYSSTQTAYILLNVYTYVCLRRIYLRVLTTYILRVYTYVYSLQLRYISTYILVYTQLYVRIYLYTYVYIRTYIGVYTPQLRPRRHELFRILLYMCPHTILLYMCPVTKLLIYVSSYHSRRQCLHTSAYVSIRIRQHTSAYTTRGGRSGMRTHII
jgi:hypothetical protein